MINAEVKKERLSSIFSERWAGVTVFLLSLIYFAPECLAELSFYDEGSVVYGAWRILDGDIPYRDFWSAYAPGQYYFVAFLFWLFGKSVLVERVYNIITCALIAVCVYSAAKKVSGTKMALLSWFITIAYLSEAHPIGSLPAGLLLSMASCLCLLKYIDKRRVWWLFLTGAATGTTVVFRHDFGFYVSVINSIIIILFIYKAAAGNGCASSKAVIEAFRQWSIFVCGAAIVVLPVVLLLLSAAGFQELKADLITFPMKIFPAYRRLPYPAPCVNPVEMFTGKMNAILFFEIFLSRVIYYLPVIYVVTIWQLVMLFRQKTKFSERQWMVLLFLLFGIAFFNYARIRADTGHMTGTNIAAAILLAASSASFDKTSPFRRQYLLRVITGFLVIAALLSSCHFFIRYTVATTLSFRDKNIISLNVDGGECIREYYEVAEALQGAVDYIKEKVPADERIFVGNLQHDNILINDIMFYFLSNRCSATKYHELHCGVATTFSVQNHIIQELKKYDVKYIVIFWAEDSISKEPNKSSESSGVVILDDFIRANYIAVANFGYYGICRKIGI